MFRRVNLLIDYGSHNKVARLSLSTAILWIVIPVLCLIIGGAAYAIASRVKIQVDKQSLVKLREENKLLQKKYIELSEQVDSAGSMLKSLARHDIQLRVQANMQILPEDMRKAGVGGTPFPDPNLRSLKKLRSPLYNNVENISESVDKLLTQARFQKDSFREIYTKLENDSYLRDHTPSIRPCNGWQCSGFGRRIDPFTRRLRMHNGIDIANAHGTPIVAPADGTVSYTGARAGYGLCVKIDHENGVESFFAHLSAIHVKKGAKITRGQLIGSMGATGRTTGTHLHYEIRVGGTPVNPMNYIINPNIKTNK